MANPMIVSIQVGVKSPVTGTGSADAVAVAFGVAVALGVAVGVEVAIGVDDTWVVGVGVGVSPDPEAVKAGNSPAWTIKFLVSVLVMPSESIQETVIE